jgi:hypothetical protein
MEKTGAWYNQSKLSKLIDYHSKNNWVTTRLGQVDSRFSDEGMKKLYEDLVEHTKKHNAVGKERNTSLGTAIFNAWMESNSMVLSEDTKDATT